MDSFFHLSIMLRECVDGLAIKPSGLYVDATLGGGGHSEAILTRLGNGGRLIGLDRDQQAIDAASLRLARFGDRFTAVKSDFRHLKSALFALDIQTIDGILFDFGVSSPQLDDSTRGFSYMADAPLDMRMDRQQPQTAYDIINTYPESELRRIFFEFGEERFSGPIAAAIARRRQNAPIETTKELSDTVISALPAKARREDQHPAKRVFQAVRIAVNDELAAIAEVIPDAVSMLAPGGRIAAISFHSLEDRLVKTAFVRMQKGCTCPPDFPVCVCGKTPEIRILTKKPVLAGPEELLENPRARSAKLRIAEKC